jgi:hypothetical protein
MTTSTVRLALPDLPHHRVHIGVVPDLGELVVFEAIKSELLNSDREVHRDIVAVDNEVPYLPMPVRKCGEQRCESRRNGGWLLSCLVPAFSGAD